MAISKKLITLFILALISIFLAVRTTFYHVPLCESFGCFQEAMKECKKVKYLNEELEATWKYEILGIENSECITEVTLLQPKAGELDIETLSGFSMECDYPKGVAVYPEKDLDRCHGRLKEELQVRTIKKLHAYIIENLGEIDESLRLLSYSSPAQS